MIVVVSKGVDGRAVTSVNDVDDLSSLHIEIVNLPDAAADEALRQAGSGYLEGDHAWLAVNSLRSAGDAAEPWQQRFAAMLGYAESKGWMLADGSFVRAHIVRR